VEAVAPKLCNPTVAADPSLIIILDLSLYQLANVALSVQVADVPELGNVLKSSLAVGDDAVKFICADKEVYAK
jgi:hypothetical protein